MAEVMVQDNEIRSAVRERYGKIAREFDKNASSCCGPSACCGESDADLSSVQMLYESPDVAELPADVTGMSLGCGDPVTLAELKPGQTVLDLGSGGGIDCFLAAKQVGSDGHVIGVDMTADMIEKARENAGQLAADNVEFRLGEIEHLPVADESVDVVISNCVINLSPDKPQVFREIYRVLRPGGRLAVSDIVTRVALPSVAKSALDSWAACIAGASMDSDYVAAIEAAGFADVQISAKDQDQEIVTNGADQMSLEAGITIDPTIVYSARVTAAKPMN